ncbi:MAG TPA: sulfite exporter TauE/SafE family protein [Anaerolineae bacterium]|nr:sulfite exporter TauE/SafE family protein [Anaerolineae bacterium]HIP73991.1 sulfite exporter TauE/SafE family protein [Anaerolineae bacterium]
MIVTLIVFLAILTQATVGFGLALISMPLLVAVLGIKTATPLVALIATAAELVILGRYWRSIQFQSIKPLIISSVIGIPLGVFILREVDAAIITPILGVVILGYALYALFSPRLPRLVGRAWAYGFGFIGGILGGAYNTSGPPVIVYGSCRRWPPDEFKGNLQGYFIPVTLLVLVVHGVSGNYTTAVWQNFLWAIPGIILGLIGGFFISGRLDPARFRKVVLILLLFLGLRLLF